LSDILDSMESCMPEMQAAQGWVFRGPQDGRERVWDKAEKCLRPQQVELSMATGRWEGGGGGGDTGSNEVSRRGVVVYCRITWQLLGQRKDGRVDVLKGERG
jgi:hypothetical protein